MSTTKLLSVICVILGIICFVIQGLNGGAYRWMLEPWAFGVAFWGAACAFIDRAPGPL